MRINFQLEYCFAREKEIVFAQEKQSLPMSTFDFAEMTILLCLIWFFFHLCENLTFLQKNGRKLLS